MGQIVKKNEQTSMTRNTQRTTSIVPSLYMPSDCAALQSQSNCCNSLTFCSGSVRDVQHSSSISLIQVCLGECMHCAGVRVCLLTMSLMAYGCARVRAASFSEAGTLASCLAIMASNTFCLCIHSISEILGPFACTSGGRSIPSIAVK